MRNWHASGMLMEPLAVGINLPRPNGKCSMKATRLGALPHLTLHGLQLRSGTSLVHETEPRPIRTTCLQRHIV